MSLDKLALVLMIKNEEKRIEVSFDSIRPYTDTFIILDTGSTDRTIEICRSYCKKHFIKLFLKEEPFINFCISRNVLLDYADSVLKNQRYLLLLDCNDELRQADKLIEFIQSEKGVNALKDPHNNPTGYHLKQQWWTGGSLDTYYNIRMVVSHVGWRFKGVVHEYIAKEITRADDIIRLDNVILYQDRTKDDDKSMKRFNRDKDMLYTEYIKDPTEPRTIFYLAQTCSCLGLHSESYRYYLERTKYIGFVEEIYHAYYRLGELSASLGHPWDESLNWYLKAFAHSQRVEPLVKLAEHYRHKNAFGENKADFLLAYHYISIACKLMYPHTQILFVDRHSYLYKRWHLLGIIGFYAGRYKEGKEAVIKALQYDAESKIDQDNLQFYLQKDKDIIACIKGTGKFNFPSLLMLSIEGGDLASDNDIGSGMANTTSREDILKKALTRFLKKN
jgi:glycosyltransferase involved in cell wall biosynthesis